MKNAYLDRKKVIDFLFYATDKTDFSKIFDLTTKKLLPKGVRRELDDREVEQAVAFLKAWHIMSTVIIEKGRRTYLEEYFIASAEELRIDQLVVETMNAIHSWISITIEEMKIESARESAKA